MGFHLPFPQLVSWSRISTNHQQQRQPFNRRMSQAVFIAWRMWRRNFSCAWTIVSRWGSNQKPDTLGPNSPASATPSMFPWKMKILEKTGGLEVCFRWWFSLLQLGVMVILRCSQLCFFSREKPPVDPQVWDYDDRSKKPMELPPARRAGPTAGWMSCVGIFHPRKCMDGSRFSNSVVFFCAQYKHQYYGCFRK